MPPLEVLETVLVPFLHHNHFCMYLGNELTKNKAFEEAYLLTRYFWHISCNVYGINSTELTYESALTF